MARWFRFYEKKRGHRRTGSPVLGMLGELCFHGAVFFLGCLAFALILVSVVIPDWRQNRDFIQTDCTVLDSSVAKIEKNGVMLYRPTIRIRYEVAGETRVTTAHEPRSRYTEDPKQAEAWSQPFVPGQKYSCWYDPANPEIVVLVRGYHWGYWLFLVVPAALIVVGGVGLLHGLIRWRTSAERRALWTQQAQAFSRSEGSPVPSPQWPGIPLVPEPNESPGTTLAYRLPMLSERGWTLAVSFVVCVLWNGVVLIFVILLVSQHVQGEPDWLGTAFLLPFALVGGGSIYWFFRELVWAAIIGPTIVEVSHHPLQAGGRYEVFLSQGGRLKMEFLEILLVCEEEAIYRQGTATRQETVRVYEDRLFRQEDFRIAASEGFQIRCPLVVPPSAMHSFHSPHNKVQWTILVHAQAHGWPPFQRRFPLVILPAHGEESMSCRSSSPT
ncbi:MAG: DUF3592 domain-containing protein [Thermoguttaceae bacterium]|nr:DUF3592 domain-containing protein [Thermoguttaceae bacterium]MDW8037852.1 DUF3592 domain-containing protein [Thermoguttaceae bacterium]